MKSRQMLIALFAMVLVSMMVVTGWASAVQPVWQWSGLKQMPNHAWTIATLLDAYFGFVTFYVWVAYKERLWRKRIIWFIAIMGLGNMAMAVYLLKELWRLGDDGSTAELLIRQNR